MAFPVSGPVCFADAKNSLLSYLRIQIVSPQKLKSNGSHALVLAIPMTSIVSDRRAPVEIVHDDEPVRKVLQMIGQEAISGISVPQHRARERALPTHPGWDLPPVKRYSPSRLV